MNATIAMKKIPVTRKVNDRVSSIVPQLEPRGEICHGLTKWKITDANSNSAKIIATIIEI